MGYLGNEELEIGNSIFARFPVSETSDQAVTVDIIQPNQMLKAMIAHIGSTLAVRLTRPCPARSFGGRSFQRAEKIVTDDKPALESQSIERQKSLFFGLSS